MISSLLAAAALAFVAPQEVETKVAASNGEVITVRTDTFAGRTVYDAETISGDGSRIQVTASRTPDTLTGPLILATIAYSGSWRFYERGVFRGGDEAPVMSIDRRVGRCSSSRYGSSCGLQETVAITFTPEMVAARSANGVFAVQVSGRTPDTFMIEVPSARLIAIMEVVGTAPAASGTEPDNDTTTGSPQ